MHLSAIWIYPVKSFYGISLSSSQVLARGLEFDRRWMVTDPQGKFITQREVSDMVLIGTEITPEGLRLFHRNRPNTELLIPFEPDVPEPMRVEVWGDSVRAEAYELSVSVWLKDVLGFDARLVKMPETVRRQVDTRYGKTGQFVSFADGFPLLATTDEAIMELNSRLKDPVDMRRFRPNVVISGAPAHAEDDWNAFTIGNVSFTGVKKCARCPVTTINPDSAEKGKEPLKALGDYRRANGKVYFGQNVIPLSEGRISVGDLVSVG